MLKKLIQKGWPALVAFIWPFLYFIDYVVSINGHYSGIANDLRIVYYPYKPYLLDRLVHLNFPLWSPSESVGFPFYSSPLTQTFYPLNIPLAIFYKLAGGLTLLDYQVYTILGIAIFALGLYFWLKTLGFNGRAILFAVLCMSVSFKVAETTRHANSIQELAWYPWILLALTRIFQANTWKRLILYGLLLFFAMLCLFTGGYPYFMYYSLFLIGPYLLALVIPRLRKAFWGLPPGKIVRPLLVAAASAGSALLLCLPYLLEMQQLLKQSGERGGGTFEYATAHDFAFRDVVGSLIYPPSSQTEGWSYFGLIGLLLVILFFAGVFPVWGARKNSLKDTVVSLYESWWVKGFFLLWFLLITLVAMGKNSLLFVFLWKYMPFFEQLRVWGRVNIILVPVLAWIVAAAYMGLERLVMSRREPASGGLIAKWRAEIILVIAYLVILGVQLYLWTSKAYDEYWIKYVQVRPIPGSEELYIWVGAASFVVLLLLLVFSRFKNFGGVKSLSLIALVLVLGSAGEKRIFGGGVWWTKRTTEARQVYNIYDQDLMSLKFLRSSDCFELSLSPAFCVLPHQNWFYNRYTDFYNQAGSEQEARDVLIGVKNANRLYFSDSIAYPTVTAFLADAGRYGPSFSQVKSYTGDDLAITVIAPAPAGGYVSFIDNWDVDWKAEVDGQAAPIEKLFGTFKSVHVSAGEHQVLFSYRPGIFWQINNLLLNLRTKLHFKNLSEK